VFPGIGVSASSAARSRITSATNATSAASASTHASPTYSRNAAATWSLRDRPAWIFLPTSPSNRSIAEWTSSSSSLTVPSAAIRSSVDSTTASSSFDRKPAS